MTVIKWLIDKLGISEITHNKLFEIAKEMHKEEIKMAYHNGYSNAIQEKPKQYNPEQYYQETFDRVSNTNQLPQQEISKDVKITSFDEISNKEIQMASIERLKVRLENSDIKIASADALGFVIGAEWYREQLKQRQIV